MLSNYAELSQMLRISHAVILRALSTTALGRLNGYGSWNRFSSLCGVCVFGLSGVYYSSFADGSR